QLALQLFGLIPGNEIVGQAADAFVNWIAGLSTEGVPLIPHAFQFESLLTPLYQLGTWALEAILIALLANALLPGQIDRLWSDPERGATPRFVLLVVDYALGVGAFAMVVAGFFILLTAEQRAAIWEGLSLGPFILLIAAGLFAAAVGGARRVGGGSLRGTPLGRGGLAGVTRSVGIFLWGGGLRRWRSG